MKLTLAVAALAAGTAAYLTQKLTIKMVAQGLVEALPEDEADSVVKRFQEYKTKR